MISGAVRPETIGANIETNMQDARKDLGSLSLEDNVQIVFLDEKQLYTNVPVGDAVEIALREFFSGKLAPEIPRSAMKNLLKLLVTNLYFNGNGFCYVQQDDLAMGA